MKSIWIVASLLLGSTAFAEINLQPTSEAPTVLKKEYRATNYRIERLLERERRVKTVRESMNLKTSGLRFVEDLWDFALLTSTPFENPSDGYKTAVSDFVVRHLNRFLDRHADLHALLEVEGNTYYVRQSMEVKKMALPYVRNVRQLIRISRPSNDSPSESYLNQISNFIGENTQQFVRRNTRIRALLRLESMTTLVGDAMAVKRAGLVACRNNPDKFWELTEHAFRNPSSSYVNAVNNFIDRHINEYGQ